MKKNRRWLYVVLAAGLIGLGASSGTFATFNAQTTNAGNTFSTGSLYLTDQASGGSACTSYQTNTDNSDAAQCGGIVTVSTNAEEPGDLAANTVAITNSGTLNASSFDLAAPRVQVELTAPVTLTNGTTSYSLTTDALETNVVADDDIVLQSGSNSVTCTASAAASTGATSLPVSCTVDSSTTYPIGTTVVDTTTNTSSTNTDCVDSHASGQSALGSLNPTTGNPLCSALQMFVLEISQSNTGESDAGTFTNLWYGGSAAVTTTLSSGLSKTPATTSLSVNTLPGAVAQGDTIAVIDTTSTSGLDPEQLFTASSSAAAGATSIAVDSASATEAFPMNSTVIDLSTLNAEDTVSNFDQAYGTGTPLSLLPLSGNGAPDSSGTYTPLPATASRKFLVGLYLPDAASSQNQLQFLTSTFGLSWYIQQ